MTLKVYTESFALKQPFVIAHGTRTHSTVVVAELTQDGITGLGECYPYERYGETTDSVITQINAITPHINTLTRHNLQELCPAGAARHALDTALWNIESKRTGQPVWTLAKLPKPTPITTAYTLVIDTPANLASWVQKYPCNYPLLKIKCAGDGLDHDRITAIRDNAPTATIIIDANESWTAENIEENIDHCHKQNVHMIEQPLPAQHDDPLRALKSPIPLCADEACHTTQDLAALKGKYDMVNIKLDKTGGLTEALKLLHTAKEMGFKIMVGCMVSTSLSMKNAYYLAQLADIADIDGPLLLKQDRPNGLIYKNARVSYE